MENNYNPTITILIIIIFIVLIGIFTQDINMSTITLEEIKKIYNTHNGELTGNAILGIFSIIWIYSIISLTVRSYMNKVNKIIWFILLITIPPIAIIYIDIESIFIKNREE